MALLFEILRYVTLVYNLLSKYWELFVGGYTGYSVRKYFLSDDDEFDDSYTRVPEGAVFVEEWTNKNGKKLCYIRYEGEEIPEFDNPFNKKLARCPWLGIGDEDTEIDLTRTFNKFLVPGNRIQLDLIEKLIHITEKTKLNYIDAKTLEMKKFPGDGILIEEDVA